jgi:pSer/pThr/pTyr-binding forkhead associated (FHA) protein
VLYGPDRQVLRYFPLRKDATLIGRLDAPDGNFPDIDLDQWLEPATARRISRQHALVLRSRATGNYSLRPLPGNTGTQVEAEMVLPMNDYPLSPGLRLILGGVARFKFEVT